MISAYEVHLNNPRILEEVEKVLQSGWLTQGPVVEQLEAAWARLCNQPHAVAVSSGQAALEIALSGAVDGRIAGGSRPMVIVPANAFSGDVAAVIRAGCDPLFVDIDEYLQIDVDAVRAVEDYRVLGVLAVHIGGWMSNRMDELKRICLGRGWFLIEDACQAHGVRQTESRGRAGTWGDATVFSFYATKVVTCGEGGMIVTLSPKFRDYAFAMRCNGRPGGVWGQEVTCLAGDCRLSDILAAIALRQTKIMETLIAERAMVASVYDSAVSDDRWRPLRIPGVEPNYYKYIVVLDGLDRAAVADALWKEGVECSSPVYERPVYEFGPWKQDLHLPMAERLCANHLCLPTYNGLGQGRAAKVAGAVKRVLEGM